MYCGNNRKHKDVLSGEKKIGSRYDCFRKGVGIGLNLPLDPDYDGEYEPIDKRKIYCGKNKKLPPGYSYLGNPSICLRKGVGVGKKKKASKSKN